MEKRQPSITKSLRHLQINLAPVGDIVYKRINKNKETFFMSKKQNLFLISQTIINKNHHHKICKSQQKQRNWL